MATKKGGPLLSNQRLTKTVLSGGKHSKPRVVRSGSKRFLFKRLSVGKALSLEEAKTLSQAMVVYNLALKKAGVNVATLHMSHPIRDQRGGYFVGSLEEFITRKTAQSEIAHASSKIALALFGATFAEVYKAVKQNNTKAKLMIDPKLSNFSVDKQGRVVYIDFYTPKLATSTGQLTPYVEKLHSKSRAELTKRYGDRQAVIHLLLAYAISTRPRLRKPMINHVATFLRNVGENELARSIIKACEITTSPKVILTSDYGTLLSTVNK